MFFGAVVLLVPILMQGPTRMRLQGLREMFAVSVRTLRRWRRWWRETFPASRFWLEVLACFVLHPAAIHDDGQFHLPARDGEDGTEVRDVLLQRRPFLALLNDRP